MVVSTEVYLLFGPILGTAYVTDVLTTCIELCLLYEGLFFRPVAIISLICSVVIVVMETFIMTRDIVAGGSSASSIILIIIFLALALFMAVELESET